MIDHFNLPVSNLDRSESFYRQALAAIGLNHLGRDGRASGFGVDQWSFGLVETSGTIPRLHVAFVASSRTAVDEFFQVALAAGAISNGAPGFRQQYDPAYYATFVIGPDGHNVEAVCRRG